MVKYRIGLVVARVAGFLKLAFAISLLGSLLIGVWIPIGGVVVDNPLYIIWAVPVGFLVSALTWWLATFVYDLIVASPLALLIVWLLQERVNEPAH